MTQLTLLPAVTPARANYSARLYSVGFWDCDKNRYRPERLTWRGRPTINLTLAELRDVLRDHRKHNGGGKAAYRRRVDWQPRYMAWGGSGEPPTANMPVEEIRCQLELVPEYDSDPNMLVERTDGMTLGEILRRWRR